MNRLMSHVMTACAPVKVGARYYSKYWQQAYVVNELIWDGNQWTILVTWDPMIQLGTSVLDDFRDDQEII